MSAAPVSQPTVERSSSAGVYMRWPEEGGVLRQLEEENRQVKQIVADLKLDHTAPKAIARITWYRPLLSERRWAISKQPLEGQSDGSVASSSIQRSHRQPRRLSQHEVQLLHVFTYRKGTARTCATALSVLLIPVREICREEPVAARDCRPPRAYVGVGRRGGPPLRSGDQAADRTPALAIPYVPRPQGRSRHQ